MVKVNRPCCPREKPGETGRSSVTSPDWARGRYFDYSSTEDIFEELRRASRGGTADYYGITWSRVEEQGVFWPCP